MTLLCDIAFKYGTDKCPNIKHSFTPFYYQLLKDQAAKFKKVLEIGVGLKRQHSHSPQNTQAAGLYMWREFFPQAQIYGADVDPQLVFTDNRITTFLCDQSSKTDLQALIKKTGSDLDLVIDDGSHIPAQQIFTCLTLMPLLAKNVLYIIEDVRDPGILLSLGKYDCQEIIPENSRFPDDRLIIVKHKHDPQSLRHSALKKRKLSHS